MHNLTIEYTAQTAKLIELIASKAKINTTSEQTAYQASTYAQVDSYTTV